MAGTEKQYRVAPSKDGTYYILQFTLNGGKSWNFLSSGSKDEMDKQLGYVQQGLTTEGLTQDQAKAKADAAEGPKMSAWDPSTTKTVVSKEEYAKMGGNVHELPSQYELDHPIMYNVGNINPNNRRTDEKGYIDDDGNVHLNSRATEARSKAAEEDRAQNRDYRTAKAPSQYELDMRNKTIDGKTYEGKYVYSDNELNAMRATAESVNDTELIKVIDAELAKRAKENAPAQPQRSNLGGRTTDEWVKWMKDQGYSDEEIAAAYEKEGYSRDGEKFKAAMAKYSAAETPVETKAEAEDKVEETDKETGGKNKNTSEIREFSKNLNMFVLSAYKNGAFGDPKSGKAKLNAGFFILDKLATGLVNASLVARGMSPSQTSQWSKVLDKQTELLGKDATVQWWNGLTEEEQTAALKTGAISGTTAKTIYENTNDDAVDNAARRDALEISKLTQEQKATAQSNLTAMLARKSELQALIAQLKADQGWNSYVQAMNALVGTAKGLSSVGIGDQTSTSSQKSFQDSLTVDAQAGAIPSMYVKGGVTNNSQWANSSANAVSKSNTLNQDALALSKFADGEAYAKASKQAQMEANKELIKNLEGQVALIDRCINSWSKDLGVDTE